MIPAGFLPVLMSPLLNLRADSIMIGYRAPGRFRSAGLSLEGYMEFRVDAKGKYYTPHVSKQSVDVTVRVGGSIVRGTVHLAPDNRLKDELNGGEAFIAITNAQVWEVNGAQPLYSTEVVIINKDQIDWIFPSEKREAEPKNAV